MFRTNNNGELTEKDIGKAVKLAGWVNKARTHGGILFVDVRDRHGVTQLVFDPKHKEINSSASLNKEDVIKIEGLVRERPNKNPNIPTGNIEIICNNLTILNKSEPLPLDITGNVESTDETRLRYRYLDLRRPQNMNNLIFRHHVVTAAREFMNKQNFLEIETPLLVKSTPEGARDYLVPSRVNKHKFYALPQSPQLYKQILMIAGADRYYQIARALRDEDLRADRQPEHTQIDFEMSFVTADEIRDTVEGLFKHIFKKTMNTEIDDFPTFTYEEAMSKYGSDKPDIRFELFLNNVTDIVKKSEFKVFNTAQHIVALAVDKDFSRKEIDKLTDVAKTYHAKGLAYFKVLEDKLDAGISKFIEPEIEKELRNHLKLKPNQTVFFVADKKKVAQTAMGQIRLSLSEKLKLIKPKTFKFAWVKDFPLFSYNEDDKRWEPEHHMFSMPNDEFIEDFEKRPGEVLGNLWDLTLNGIELASGSIRVSDPKVQERIMNFIGMNKEEANEKFGFLLEAYKYGGPQHGGMGIGLDRTVALMLELEDIREVIAFPKNKNAQCPMDGSPGEVSKQQLDELNLSNQ